ncbi:MAG: MFS transporter [Planctomycetota bacterium]
MTPRSASAAPTDRSIGAAAAPSTPVSGAAGARGFGWGERAHRFASRHRRSLAASGETRRKQLVYVTTAWLFGSVWLAIVTSAVAVQYGRSLGLAEWAFGLLAAAPFIGSICQLPAAYALERWGHRRRLFLVVVTTGRLMWVAAGLVPWVLPAAGPTWAIAYGACCMAGWALQQAGGPAWMNWMGDVMPKPIRGRYMALRGRLGTAVLVVTSFVAAWVLDQAGVLQGWLGLSEGTAVLAMGSGLMIAAGVAGTIDILWFLPVPDRHPSTPNPEARLLGTLVTPLRDRRLWPYLAFFFVFHLAIGYMPAYVTLYLIDEVGFTTAGVNALMFSIPPVLSVMAMPFWGRFLDRHGKKPTLLVAGWIITLGGVGWLLMTPDRWVWPYLIVLTAVVGWPAVNLAMFNFMIELSETKRPRKSDAARRADGRELDKPSGASYLAVCSLATALGGGLSGLLGAGIAAGLYSLRFELSWLHMTLTYHGVLMLLSVALRVVALCFVMRFDEPDSKTATQALRYTTGSVYTSLRGWTVIPGRYARRSTRGVKLQVVTTRRRWNGKASGRDDRAA